MCWSWAIMAVDTVHHLIFLQHYQPKLAIASVGKWNRYGHPSKETLARLEGFKSPDVRVQPKKASIRI